MTLEQKVKIFKALSDETRLRILNLLIEKECCVCEVMQALNISQTRASRNLSALYNAGFLILRREGLWSLYSIDENKIDPFAASILRALRLHIKDNPLLARDIENLKKAVRENRLCPDDPCCSSGINEHA
ncbi:MAG: metalloregulator ArsR/SmtB family transcription factor [Dehalococcoidales bacterium]|jgi:ArsR family transcriptional regulator